MKTTDISSSSLRSERGIALVMSLIIAMVVMLMIGSILYVITNSTKISGAGKRYVSASEAGDGSVEVTKNAINLVLYGQPFSSLPLVDSTNNQILNGTPAGDALMSAITAENSPTTVYLNLAGTGMTTYHVEVTIERLKNKALPGGRLEFARSAGGSGGTAIFYRINTVVYDTVTKTKAENVVTYRFVG